MRQAAAREGRSWQWGLSARTQVAGGAQRVRSGQQRLGEGDLGRAGGREEGNEAGGLHGSLAVRL